MGPKVCQENMHHTIKPAPAAWTIDAWQDKIHAFMLFLTLPSECWT